MMRRKPKRSSAMHSSLDHLTDGANTPGKYHMFGSLSTIYIADKRKYPNVIKQTQEINVATKKKKCDRLTAVSNIDASHWVTGGPAGTKDSILVFRTSALNPNNDCNLDADAKNNESGGGNCGSLAASSLQQDNQPTCSNILEPTKCNTLKASSSDANKKSYVFSEKGFKKRTHDSLSSSENSISSACDDPTEIEEDIMKASHSLVKEAENDHRGISSSGSKRIDRAAKSNVVKDDDREQEELDEKENISDGAAVEVSEMPATKLKITYKFSNTETRLLRKILTSHGLCEANDSEHFNLLWTGVHIKADILRNLAPYQRVNHFPRSYELTRKDRLYKNIEKMQHLRGFKHFDIVPLSFMLPQDYRSLVTAHRSGHKGPWIVKPAASSRGRGIFIVNSPEQIATDDQVLVSKYIADPLCIDGHKCDVRLYVAVTSFDPLLIYMYEEGLVRLATVKYEKNVENLWNPCMHLCNYSINKYHSDYIKATDSCEDVGHKWTFSALLRHLKSQGCNTRDLMMNIEEVVVKSILASSQSIVSACRMFVPNGNNCFELYGFDILIDDTLKPWLLEINLSPSLGIDTPLDAKVKASLMTDLLTLVGLPALSPLARATYDSKWNRFKTGTPCRKTVSSDNIGQSSSKKNSSSSSTTASNNTGVCHSNAPFLTTEELRIVRNANAQYDRKGGFVRIFPVGDSMQKYGHFLDPVTGIPISTVSVTGASTCTMILPHNYNQLLFGQLFPGKASKACRESRLLDRMEQYERVLNTSAVNLVSKSPVSKCVDEARRLRQQVRRLIESGNEMSQLQARRAFHQYLECVLRRLTQEPKSLHEKQILKFITRSSSSIKVPSFIKNPYSQKILSKDRSAMVAKLLGDYLEAYNRDTESYADDCDRFGIMPRKIFDDFLAQAQESDLESVLTLHTNYTQSVPFLYNRCSMTGVQAPPPIPTGANGFLKALPAMPSNVTSKDLARIDTYYKSLTNLSQERRGGDEMVVSVMMTEKQERVMSTSTTLPAARSLNMQPLKKRSISQTAVNRIILKPSQLHKM